MEPLQSNKTTENFVYNERSTVRSILPDELDYQDFKTRLATLDNIIEIKCGDPVTLAEVEEYGENMVKFDEEAQLFEHRLLIDDDGITDNSCADERHAMPDQDDEPTPEHMDEFITINVLLPRGEGYQRATISRRKHNSSGKTIGSRNANPFLDTRVYEAEFPDVEGVAISANTMATSLFDNYLYDGHDLMLFRSLLDHKSDMMEFQRDDAFVKCNGSNSKRKNTTRVWQLIVE